MTPFKWLAGFLGLGIVVFLFQSIGWAEISRPLLALDWQAVYILLPFFLSNAVNSWAWVCTFPPPFSKYPLSFSNIYWMRICGEFVNNFTPTAHVGGDVSRVLFLKKFSVPGAVGAASVLMDKAAFIVTEILFIYTGIFLLLFQVDFSATVRWIVAGSLLLGLLVIYGVIAAMHKGLFSKVSGALGGKFDWPFLKTLHAKVARLDAHLTDYYRNHHDEFLRSNYLHYAGWVLGALETWAILYLLGVPVGPLDALMIEAIMTLVKGLGFFIPGSLGALEGGSVLLFQMLDFGQGLGLAFSLLKRARELIIGALGWVVLSVQLSALKPGGSQTTSS